MIDEPPRGAEGLQGERAGSSCSCQGAPILGGSWRGTSARVLGGRLISHVLDKPTVRPTWAKGEGWGRPGLNSDEGGGPK